MIFTPIVHAIVKIILPLILVFACSILLNGEDSPGGAFQAGALFASYFILHAVSFNTGKLTEYLKESYLLYATSVGVVIYLLIGFSSMILGYEFLDYNAFFSDQIFGQKFCIMCIEIGITITVSTTILLIYKLFSEENFEQ